MPANLKKLKRITESKTFLVLFSVVCGVVAWLFVLDTNNPVIEKTVSVEMEFINFNEPAQKNLTLVSDLGIVSADIKISGREDIVNNVMPSDLSLKVDFSQVKDKGTAYIDVDKPSCDKLGVKIEDYYPKEIAVTYDTQLEMYLPVKTDFEASLLKSGYEILSMVTEPDNIPVSGFASQLENLEYIRVNLSDSVVDGTIDGDKTLSFIGRYITSTGQDVTANFSTEKITVKLDVAKRVPVKYRISGVPAKDYYLTGDSISNETVLVDGSTAELAELTEIDLGIIDIEGSENTVVKQFKIDDYLQRTLFACETTVVEVRAEISPLQIKELVLSPEDISQTGRNNEVYRYNITFDESIMDGKGNIIVKVKGKAEDIADLKLSSMRPTLDMSGKEGIYRMQSVEFDLPEGITLIGEYLADIEISLIPASTPIFVPTPTAASEPTPTQEPATEIPSESPPATDESTETSPAATPENGGDVESGSLS